MNDTDRAQWRRSRLSKRAFIRANRAEITQAIENVTNWTPTGALPRRLFMEARAMTTASLTTTRAPSLAYPWNKPGTAARRHVLAFLDIMRQQGIDTAELVRMVDLPADKLPWPEPQPR